MQVTVPVPLPVPSLFDDLPQESPVPSHRIRVLATVLAGMRWPGRGSYEKLKKEQQQACQEAAKLALDHLANKSD